MMVASIRTPLDDYEIRMLRRLQRDGRVPVTELAASVGLSATPCARRLEGLQARGVITGFGARVDRRALGLSIQAFIAVKLLSHSDGAPDAFRDAVAAMDEVVGCWAMTGDQDFLLNVMVTDVDGLNQLIMERLMHVAGVHDVKTNLVLQTVKAPQGLPLTHL